MSPGPPIDLMIPKLGDILSYVIHADSLLAIGVLSVILSVLDWVGTLPGVLSGGAFLLARLTWVTYFYLVARKAAIGSRRLPVPSDYLDTWDAFIQPLIQGLLATFWYWAGLLSLIHFSVGLVDFVERYRAHPLAFLIQQGLLGQVFLVVGTMYIPLALLATLCCRHMLHVFDPRLGFRLALHARWAYAGTFAMVCAFGLIGFIMDALGGMLETVLPIPLAAPVLDHLLRLWTPLAQARLLGEFAYCHRSVLKDRATEDEWS